MLPQQILFAVLGLIAAAAQAHAQVGPTLPSPARAPHAQSSAAASLFAADAASCEAAIARAEARYRLPPGLLFAIGLAESGRADPITGRARPWPWAVQAGERSLYFETKDDAVSWVRVARAQGTASIDTGCLQVNLMFHPDAFANLEAAFDPESNVDYAARFLARLHDETQDWMQATGFYHSRTPSLAAPYQQHVQASMGQASIGPRGLASVFAVTPPKEVSIAAQLAMAWSATTEAPPATSDAGAAGGRAWSTLLQVRPQLEPTVRTPRLIAALSAR